MKNKRRKINMILTAITVMTTASLGLSGCSKDASTNPPPTGSTAESTVSGGNKKEENLTTRGNSETMVESGNHLYFKYNHTLWSIEKDSDRMEQIYTFEEGTVNTAFWVYNNNLYFDVAAVDEYKPDQASTLYKMNLETKQEEKIGELPSAPSTLYASEGILYVKGYDLLRIYKLKEDGSLDQEISVSDTLYKQIPEDCEELDRGIMPYLVEQNGYMPLTNGENLVIADKNGENATSVPEVTNTSAVLFAKDAFYDIYQESENSYICRRFDIATLKPETLFETTNYPTLMQEQDGYLYYLESGSYGVVGADSSYYQVDIKNKSITLAAKIAPDPGTLGFCSYYGNFYVTGKTAYCQQIKDYGVYVEKTGLLDMNNKTMLETPIYQSPIKELGSVQAETKDIPCACGQKTAVEVYVEQFVFSGNSQAVTAMNQVMEDYAQNTIKYGEQMMDPSDESWIHDETFRTNTLTSQISDINYLDDRYCCIEVDGYEYTGGAHGTPTHTYFVFDRKTGTRLGLADLINTSESDLKTIVSGAFRALAEKSRFSFDDPETLEKTVAEGINYNSTFYITDRGIVFYYQPYEIAAYAVGFPEVVIPYESFDMKNK
ncbi:MAG: RsiV family protein [Clostridium sp.]